MLCVHVLLVLMSNLILRIVCVLVCHDASVMHTNAVAHGGQKRTLYSPELKLKVIDHRAGLGN